MRSTLYDQAKPADPTLIALRSDGKQVVVNMGSVFNNRRIFTQVALPVLCQAIEPRFLAFIAEADIYDGPPPTMPQGNETLHQWAERAGVLDKLKEIVIISFSDGTPDEVCYAEINREPLRLGEWQTMDHTTSQGHMVGMLSNALRLAKGQKPDA